MPPRLALLTKLDGIVLHPVVGSLLLAAVLFLMFQAVFSWAETPMDLIDAGVGSDRRSGSAAH